jgi:hypothetical protein
MDIEISSTMDTPNHLIIAESGQKNERGKGNIEMARAYRVTIVSRARKLDLIEANDRSMTRE